MKNSIYLSVLHAVGMVAILFHSTSVFAYDDLPRPPPLKNGVLASKPTEASVPDSFNKKLQERYTVAAGDLRRPLTQAQAKAAGWGLVSDNFKAIDRNGDGSILFTDLTRFMAERTPQKIMAATRAKP